MQFRAHRFILLLDSISKLVERTTAHLTADHLERRNKLYDAVDTVAILMNRTQQAWKGRKSRGPS